MNLSETIVSKKVLFIKRKLEMRKVMTMITQILIFTVAWFVMTPDVAQDNTYLFGLIGSYDVIPGNTHWVMLGAAVLSAFNIWLWWPKSTTHQTVAEAAKGTKSAEAKETKAEDPIVPKMD